jgi:hypothetical protein
VTNTFVVVVRIVLVTIAFVVVVRIALVTNAFVVIVRNAVVTKRVRGACSDRGRDERVRGRSFGSCS